MTNRMDRSAASATSDSAASRIRARELTFIMGSLPREWQFPFRAPSRHLLRHRAQMAVGWLRAPSTLLCAATKAAVDLTKSTHEPTATAAMVFPVWTVV